MISVGGLVVQELLRDQGHAPEALDRPGQYALVRGHMLRLYGHGRAAFTGREPMRIAREALARCVERFMQESLRTAYMAPRDELGRWAVYDSAIAPADGDSQNVGGFLFDLEVSDISGHMFTRSGVWVPTWTVEASSPEFGSWALKYTGHDVSALVLVTTWAVHVSRLKKDLQSG